MKNMTIESIVTDTIMVGDELQINEWDNHFKVCAMSERFFLAHHGEMEYTIIQRTPTDFGPFNGIPAGSIICGPDWWSLGWLPEKDFDRDDGSQYQFSNPEWCKLYMADLESGRTEVSMRNRAMIWDLKVYRSGVCVAEV